MRPYAPVLTPFQIEREKLGERISGAADNVRLIVLCAPAGFGKTTAMLQHAGRLGAFGTPHAWLTLDSSYNDVSHFVARLGGALEVSAPGAGAALLEGGVIQLVERRAATTEAFTLFLDDFEAIHNTTVLEVIRQLVEHMPPGWQMVIGSRVVPELRLGRMRARGQLVEIGAEQLRFSLDEVREFLCGQRKLELSGALLERLQSVTEGWATALWLASVSLERDPEPERFLATFSGSDAAIAEFLAEDVLDRQPESLRDFLLRSSVLTQMQAELCDAVLERDDSAEMLAQLSRGNLFLMSTDNLGNFRYHALFADFLRARLRQREPGRVPGLHLRAAQWYEAQGRPVPAIEHALQAGDEALVVRLLGAHAQPLLDAGRFRLLARWIGSLPTALVDAHPRLRLIEAWALAYINRGQQAWTLLDRLEAQRVQNDEAEDDEVRANILALRPLLMMFRDEPGGFAAALRNQPQVAQRHGFAYSQLTNMLAQGHAAADEYDTARALLAGARRLHRETGNTFGLVYAECLEGAISLAQGHLQDALARLRGAMNHMPGDDARCVDRNSIAAAMYAEALYESGQPDQAERLLNIYLPQVRETGMVDVEVRGYLILARIAWRQGGQERAFDLLADLERHGQQDNLVRSLICADLERARLELLRGDSQASAASLARAQAHAEQYEWSDGVQPLHGVESFPLAYLRLRLHEVKDEASAAALLADLDAAIQVARARQRHRQALHLTLLRIDALHRSGQRREAQAGLAEALASAAAQCIVQPFAEEGAALAGLALAWMQSPEGSAKLQAPELAAFAERLETACIAAGGRPEALPAAGTPDPAPRTPTIQVEEGFTRRELDVLNLLVQGKSNDQIAQQLFVSRNTVRTHVRNILGKLGVSNRTEAVVAAHQQGLVG